MPAEEPKRIREYQIVNSRDTSCDKGREGKARPIVGGKKDAELRRLSRNTLDVGLNRKSVQGTKMKVSICPKEVEWTEPNGSPYRKRRS